MNICLKKFKLTHIPMYKVLQVQMVWVNNRNILNEIFSFLVVRFNKTFHDASEKSWTLNTN